MTWEDMQEWLLNRTGLGPRPCGGVAPEAARYVHGWPEEIAQHEPNERAGIDAYVRAIASEGPLPPLTPIQKCLLAQRLHFAVALCDALAECEEAATTNSPPIFGATWSAAQKCDYLLVTAWHQLGCRLWLELALWQDEWTAADLEPPKPPLNSP